MNTTKFAIAMLKISFWVLYVFSVPFGLNSAYATELELEKNSIQSSNQTSLESGELGNTNPNTTDSKLFSSVVSKISLCLLRKSKKDLIPVCRAADSQAEEMSIDSRYFAVDPSNPKIYFLLSLQRRRKILGREKLRFLEFKFLKQYLDSAPESTPSWPDSPFPVQLLLLPVNKMEALKPFVNALQWQKDVEPELETNESWYKKQKDSPEILGLGYSMRNSYLLGYSLLFGITAIPGYQTGQMDAFVSLGSFSKWWKPLQHILIDAEYISTKTNNFKIRSESSSESPDTLSVKDQSFKSHIGLDMSWLLGFPFASKLWAGRLIKGTQKGRLSLIDENLPYSLVTTSWIAKAEFQIFAFKTGLFGYFDWLYWFNAKTKINVDNQSYDANFSKNQWAVGAGWSSRSWAEITKVSFEGTLSWEKTTQKIVHPVLGSQKLNSEWHPQYQLKIVY